MAKLIIDAAAGVVSREFKSGLVHHDAGSLASGYKCITINKKSVLIHRLIYESVHGQIPRNLVIDHINGNKTDNRIANLRATTQASNCQNRHKVRDDSKSGLIGVEKYGVNGKFCARMMRNGKRYTIGTYDSKQDAKLAYDIASMFFNN
jgi:hypothetical protein